MNKNVGNRSVTVRFHGYNNEEEVSSKILIVVVIWSSTER